MSDDTPTTQLPASPPLAKPPPGGADDGGSTDDAAAGRGWQFWALIGGGAALVILALVGWGLALSMSSDVSEKEDEVAALQAEVDELDQEYEAANAERDDALDQLADMETTAGRLETAQDRIGELEADADTHAEELAEAEAKVTAAEERATEAEAPAESGQVIRHEGVGTAVIDITPPIAGSYRFSATHSGSSNFIVGPIHANGEEGSSLVNEIGAGTWNGFEDSDRDGAVIAIEVEAADGAWTIELTPL